MTSFPFLFFICRHIEEKKGLTFAVFSERETKASQVVRSPPQLLCRQAPGALGMKVCKKKCVGGNDLAQKWKEACPFLSKRSPSSLPVLPLWVRAGPREEEEMLEVVGQGGQTQKGMLSSLSFCYHADLAIGSICILASGEPCYGEQLHGAQIKVPSLLSEPHIWDPASFFSRWYQRMQNKHRADFWYPCWLWTWGQIFAMHPKPCVRGGVSPNGIHNFSCGCAAEEYFYWCEREGCEGDLWH